MLSAPYKGAVKELITQTYHSEHPALDMAGYPSAVMYGVPLCAPEDCEVILTRGDVYNPRNYKDELRGFSVWLKGLETGLTHFYHHLQPVLPVKAGDKIARGKIVAFMGNSGNVFSYGVYVPVEKRQAPYPGTHLHWEVYDQTYRIGGRKTFVNPLPLIDWRSQPTYTTAEHAKALAVVYGKAMGLLTKK